MDQPEDYTTKYMQPTIGKTITAIHEEDCAVFLHLSDGSMIMFKALQDGGFNVDIQPGALH